MKQGRIYIVRHGNTFDKDDLILRVGGKTDLPLSISGKIQAEKLAVEFRDIEFANAFSSNLERTKGTLEIILGHQNFQYSTFLMEIDYGPDEGRPETEVISRIGHEAIERWEQFSIPPDDWVVDTDYIRMAWKNFLSQCSPETNTIVVTSNGVARFLLDVVAGGSEAPKKLRTGAYGVIAFGTDRPLLERWDIRP